MTMQTNRLNLLRKEAEAENNRNMGMRCINANIRAAEESNPDSRTFILSFSSEEPYERWFGLEILDHSENAVDLTRLNEIGVLLFNHDVDKVIGKVERAWLENERCYAEVEFDTDDFSEMMFQKVKGGTLKSTSVRYSVDVWEEVAAGKTSSNGKYDGPCSVAVKWMPLEVSIVSVPADATVGVGRAFEKGGKVKSVARSRRSINELQLKLNKSKSL